MDQNLIQELKQTGLTLKLSKTRTGRDNIKVIPPAKVIETIKTLNRQIARFKKSGLDTKLERQFSHWSSAEANVVGNPNVETFFCFGSNSLVTQCIQAYYIHEVLPDAYSKLIVDNPTFEEKLKERIPGMKHMTKFKQKERIFCSVLAVLCLTGARALGGRNTSRSLSGLRIAKKLPSRPKKKVFRRGYNDKGSLANEQTKIARRVETEYYDILTLFAQELFLQQGWDVTLEWNTIFNRISIVTKPKHGYSEDENRPQRMKIIETSINLREWIKLNSLEGKTVTSDLLQIKSTLRG